MSSSESKPSPGPKDDQADLKVADPATDAANQAALSGEVTRDLLAGADHEAESGAGGAAASLPAGTILGERYRVVERIGRGGFGEVYSAENLTLHTRVAIKVLHLSFNDTSRAYFLQEAKISSLIQHPNVVYVIDFGVLPDQRPYLVMEFLEGDTLESVIIKHGRLSPLRASIIALQVVHGLQAIHKKSIVHLDLKPRNLMLVQQATDKDFVKILDFGIAQIVHSDTSERRRRATNEASSPGFIQGTPGYMSPEQIAGQPPSTQSDQYSLGCILFRMLTGILPSVSTSIDDILLDRPPQEPPYASKICPDAGISPQLDAIVHRCIQSNPASRFPNLAALAAELDLTIQSMQVAAQVAEQVAMHRSRESANSQAPTIPSEGSRKRLSRLPYYLFLPIAVMTVLFLAFRNKNPIDNGNQLSSSIDTKQARREAFDVLTDLAAHSNSDIRTEAISALSDSHEPAIQATLRARLQDPVPAVRVTAATALAQFAEKDGLAALRALMQQRVSVQVTTAAARALMHLGDRTGEQALHAALRSADQEGQIRAVLALCSRPPAEALELMHRYVAASQPGDIVGIELLGCLASHGDSAAREQLRTRTKVGLPSSVRIAAAARLLRSGDPMGADVLLSMSKTPAFEQLVAARTLAGPQYPETRALFRALLGRADAEQASLQLAIEGIGEAGELADVALLQPILRSSRDVALRLAAAAGIIHILGRDPAQVSMQALAWAKQALSSPDEAVRVTALDVLAVLHSEDSQALLASLLRDPSVAVRRRSVLSLSRHSGSASAALLRQALQDPDATVRIDALRAIGALAQRYAQSAPELAQRMISWLRDFLQAAQSEPERVVARGALLASGDATQRSQLAGMLAGSSPELRLLLLAQLSSDADSLAKYLADSDFRVRFSAARHLAMLRDARAVPTLQEAAKGDGPDSILATGLLHRLAPSPGALDRWLTLGRQGTVAQRIQVAQLAELLSADDAHALLRILLTDADPQVRAAALAALSGRPEPLPQQLELLGSLLHDPDPALRHRAQLLRQAVAKAPPTLARSHAATEPASVPATSGSAPADLGVVSTAPEHAAAASASGDRGHGQLVLRGPHSTLCSIDKGGWQACDGKTLSLPSGAHTIATLDASQQVTVPVGGVLQIELSESRAEQYTRTGLDALRRGDPRKGQKLLERVEATCSAKALPGCQILLVDVQLALGESYEVQGRLSDAMAAFQKAAARLHGAGSSGTASKATKVAKVEAAVRRLQPRLGRVHIFVAQQGKCQREVRWLPPGRHEVILAGQPQPVTVRAQQIVSVGECR